MTVNIQQQRLSARHQENRTNDRPETTKHIFHGRANHAMGYCAGDWLIDNCSFIIASMRSTEPQVVTRSAFIKQAYLF